MIDTTITKNETTIYLYGSIGLDFTDKEFTQVFSKINTQILNVRINSPGGNVFQGYAIYNLLKSFRGTVNIFIDGIAASMSSIIALGGVKIYMAENAMYMIHNPHGADKALLQKIKAEMVKTYAIRTKIDPNTLDLMLTQETWLNSTEAKSRGFVDEIISDVFKVDSSALYIAASSEKALRIYNKYLLTKNNEEMDLKKILSKLKLPADADEADVLDAIDELQKIKDGSDDLTAEKQKGETAAIKSLLDQAVYHKKITADLIPQYEALLKKDFTNTAAILNGLTGVQKISDTLNYNQEGKVAGIEGKSKSQWDLDDYRKHAPLELERSPALYAELCEKAGITNED